MPHRGEQGQHVPGGDHVDPPVAEVRVDVAPEPVAPRGLGSAARLPSGTVESDHLVGSPLEGENPTAPRVSACLDCAAVGERSPSGFSQRHRRVGTESEIGRFPADDDPLWPRLRQPTVAGAIHSESKAEAAPAVAVGSRLGNGPAEGCGKCLRSGHSPLAGRRLHSRCDFGCYFSSAHR